MAIQVTGCTGSMSTDVNGSSIKKKKINKDTKVFLPIATFLAKLKACREKGFRNGDKTTVERI